MSDKRVALDCDGTLVHVHKLYPGKAKLVGVPIYERDGLSFQVVERPSARAFVERLIEAGLSPVVITGGAQRFQRFVLRVAGLDDLIETLYGYENSRDIRPAKDWVLIDDLSAKSSGTVEKLERLSGLSKTVTAADKWDELVASHYIQCHEFRGERDEHPLTELADRILERLG
jgi:phosphoglycolate phosphatase-like HAD superfamily hydrolase